MAGLSELVAGAGVEDTGAEEGGADQDVENVEHGGSPVWVRRYSGPDSGSMWLVGAGNSRGI
jgi:hypothetical protein